MFKVEKCFLAFGAALALGLSPCASGADTKVADALEAKLSSQLSSRDYIPASATAFRLASARSQMGDTAGACAALSRSLEYYRNGVIMEIRDAEVAASSIDDHSDGMAVVRARFGCEASAQRAQVAKPF